MTRGPLCSTIAVFVCCFSAAASSQQVSLPTGTYLIVNPYNTTVDGPFIEKTANSIYFGPASRPPSPARGGITGIFLRVNWIDFEGWANNGAFYNDGTKSPLQTVLTAIVALQSPITLSVGLAAGAMSPPTVLAGNNIPTINIPFPYAVVSQATNPSTSPYCLSMPDVWNDANGNFHGGVNHNRDFTLAYETALSQLITDVTKAISGSSVTLNSIKVSGINTGDVEIGMQGNNVYKYSDVPPPGCTPPSQYPKITSDSTAAFAWLQEGYLPGPTCANGNKAPLQRTWDNIATFLYTKFKSYSYIMDVFNAANFTPIGPQNCDYEAPQTCNTTQTICDIQANTPANPSAVMSLTTDYMLKLINGFVAETTGAVLHPPIAVQTDGLSYSNPPPYENQAPSLTPQEGVIVPCQANVNNNTIIGFQSATSQPITSSCQATDYENGLQNGVVHGASYLEVDVPEFEKYLEFRTSSEVSSFLSAINRSLMSNLQNGGNCTTTQSFTTACP